MAKEKTEPEDFDLNDYDLQYSKDDYEDEIVVPLSHKHILVGYLSRDEDCHNPIEYCDGMGKVLNLGRGWGDQRSSALDILGLTSNGDINPDEAAVEEELRFEVRRFDLIISPEEVERRISNFEDREAWIEKKSIELWHRDIDPTVVILNYRQYSSCDNGHYSVNCLATEWDLSAGKLPDAIWYPDLALMEELKPYPKEEWPAKCLIYARQAVEEMQKWLDGECYGVCVEIFNKDFEIVQDDACWGYVGTEYAKETLENEVANAVKHFKHKPKKDPRQAELTLP